jgi:flagellar biosynthesis/type III secretory pathway protein FliH
MSNGIYLTLEQYKDKDLPLTITINGHTYHSQFALATTQTTWFEMGKQHGMELGSDNTYSDNEMSNMHDAWFDEGYTKGYEAGYDAGIDHGIEKTLQDDRVKEELERTKQTWYAKGKEEGYEAGKWDLPAGDSGVENLTYKHGWSCGYNEGFEIGKSAGYNDGFEEGKSEVFEEGKEAGYGEGYEAGKVEALAEIEVEFPTYKHGWSCGYNDGFEEGKSEGYDEGYEIGKKANGISKKEIPGEYLSRIEEAYDDGYKEGYTDCREVAKMLNKYGIDEDGPCNDCKEEPGRDEEDGDYVGPEHPEYDKGYYAGWEDGKNHIMQFIGNESSR